MKTVTSCPHNILCSSLAQKMKFKVSVLNVGQRAFTRFPCSHSVYRFKSQELCSSTHESPRKEIKVSDSVFAESTVNQRTSQQNMTTQMKEMISAHSHISQLYNNHSYFPRAYLVSRCQVFHLQIVVDCRAFTLSLNRRDSTGIASHQVSKIF